MLRRLNSILNLGVCECPSVGPQLIISLPRLHKLTPFFCFVCFFFPPFSTLFFPHCKGVKRKKKKNMQYKRGMFLDYFVNKGLEFFYRETPRASLNDERSET